MSSLDDFLSALKSDVEERKKGGKGQRAATLLHKEKIAAKVKTMEERRAELAALTKRIDKPTPKVQKKAIVLFVDEVTCVSCTEVSIQLRFLEPMIEMVIWSQYNPMTHYRRVHALDQVEHLHRKTLVRQVEVPFCPQCFTRRDLPDVLIYEGHRTLKDEAFVSGFMGDRVESRGRDASKVYQSILEREKQEGGY